MSLPQQAHVRAEIERLIATYNGLDDATRADITESSVVTQFIEPLFRALGWPIEDPERYKKELHTQAGKPDITLLPEAGGVLFVEAKRFGVIKELKEARKTITGLVTPGQLTLPGMATDRTPQEQQAINYAFENNCTWAILTNFERLRLFNARRDWLVLSFEKPQAYLDQLDTLWLLSYESIVDGELDRLSDQRYREDVDADYLSFIDEYRLLLARDVIAHPGANRWAFIEDTDRVNLQRLRDVVQRFLDRLVVIRFAEDHFVLRPGTLKKTIEANLEESYGISYGFPLNITLRQFFRQFDTHHNSTLFAHDPVLDDQADFSTDLLARLVDRLYDARYRAMPPDIMGNTYEQYLGKVLVQVDGRIETRDNLETRKKQGSYYTPQAIVRYLVDHSLGRFLYGTADGRPDGEPVGEESRKQYTDIQNLRVLDPACGSGSFLIYAYQVLADFYRAEMARVNREAEDYGQQRAAEGISLLEIEGAISAYKSTHLPYLEDYPRIILERHLYGVDLDPQAAELAAVNLIFRVMEDQRRMRSKRKLPLILNQNVKCGNALVGTTSAPDGDILGRLRRLRAELAANSHDEHVQKAIDEVAGQLKAQLDAPLLAHFAGAGARRPFHWAAEFPECFVDEDGQPLGSQAGFDVIIGNPPWEIVKPDLREYYAQFDPDIESHFTREQAEKRIAQLDGLEPGIKEGWEAQQQRIEEDAAYYRTGAAAYAHQGRGDTALHKLFLERVWGLLKDQGRLGCVVPSGIYTDLGTKDLRQMLLNEGGIQYLFSFSNERFFFKGVHHAFHFTLLGAHKGMQSDGFWSTFRFNPRVAVAPDALPAFLATPDNLIYMKRESLERFSPDSLSVMEFQTRQDYEIAEKVYGDWPLIGQQTGIWDVKFIREFDMTNDRNLFNKKGEGLPLYEGKMIHQFDAYFSKPQYWISRENLQSQDVRIGVRAIAASTNERTLIAAMLPPMVGAGNSILVNTSMLPNANALCLISLLNSFVLDLILRSKVTNNVNMFYLYQLPLPRLIPGNPYFDAIVPRAARLTCTRPEFAGLWQEVMGEPWDASVAPTGDEREALRDEIDALVAHLYGLSRQDFEHILGTFPLVFPDTEEGRDRKEQVLGVFDVLGKTVEGWERI